MYKDIISYKLASGVSEEYLLNISKQVVDGWMKNQKGFIKWEINKNNQGNFTDIVYWESKEDAKNSEKDMGNIPNGADWYACYDKDSIVSRNLEIIEVFK